MIEVVTDALGDTGRGCRRILGSGCAGVPGERRRHDDAHVRRHRDVIGGPLVDPGDLAKLVDLKVELA